jgi:mono/diheme cytochrome c family protein
MRTRRLIGKVLVAVAALMLLIQSAPYGRNHTNPPGRSEPAWDRPQTRELAKRACFDCHSNETVWPAYARVAPISWLIQHDVDEGRKVLNFSEWQRPQEEAKEAAETVREGEMPPWTYTLIHPEARLTAEERTNLIRGLEATIGAAPSSKLTQP